MNIEKENCNKKDCFAWLSDNECNALRKKKCSNCNFYKNYKSINYSEYRKDWILRDLKIERNIALNNCEYGRNMGTD